MCNGGIGRVDKRDRGQRQRVDARNRANGGPGRTGPLHTRRKGLQVVRTPAATSAGRLGNRGDQDKGRIDEVIGASEGKRKRKAEAFAPAEPVKIEPSRAWRVDQETAMKGMQQVEDARTSWGVSLDNNGVAAAKATAARQEQASAEERERWAMRVAEVEARAADAEARAAVACECARTWQVVAERRQRKCWTWAAWEKKQAAYSIWERERHAETMRRELGSDSDD